MTDGQANLRQANLLDCPQPYIFFVVGVISQFMDKPKEVYWDATKRMLKYIKGTQEEVNICQKWPSKD